MITNKDLVKVLAPVYNFSKITKEVLDVFSKHSNGSNQIILQTQVEGNEDWLTGVGSIEKLENKQENDYVHIQPSLRGSELEQLINQYGAYRTRIMRMPPISCYSVHRDFSVRIHIPVVSNNDSFLIWPRLQVCSRLLPGLVYWTDTTKEHTAINGGDLDRIHIVMCV